MKSIFVWRRSSLGCEKILYFCGGVFVQNVEILFYEFTPRSKTDPITGAVKNTKYHQL